MMQEIQQELPQELLPPEPLKGVNAEGLYLVASDQDRHRHKFARAEQRRIEKAARKAARLGAGKAVPSAETIAIILSGEDRRQFRAALEEAQKTEPRPTKNQAALAIFRLGLGLLASMAAQQVQKENLVQLAPVGAVESVARQAMAPRRPGAGSLLAGR